MRRVRSTMLTPHRKVGAGAWSPLVIPCPALGYVTYPSALSTVRVEKHHLEIIVLEIACDQREDLKSSARVSVEVLH